VLFRFALNRGQLFWRRQVVGTTGDGKTVDTPAVNRAIAAPNDLTLNGSRAQPRRRCRCLSRWEKRGIESFL
jgi:hypothetical protein